MRIAVTAAMLLPNDTASALKRDGREAVCALRAGAPPHRAEQRFFVLFTRPHSGADMLCKLLNRHPEITCAGEPFNPTAQAANGGERLGYSVAAQREDVPGFLHAHFQRCRTRVCGFRLLPSHLPREALHRLFLPGCGVQKLILERNNVTAEFIAHRPVTSLPFDKFAKAHQEWFARVPKIMPRARSYKLSYEDLVPAAGRQHTSGQEAVLFDLFAFFDVRPEDQLCLLESCASPALAGARSYRDYAAAALRLTGERLSRAVALTHAAPGAGAAAAAAAGAEAGGRPPPPAGESLSRAKARARAHASNAARSSDRRATEHETRVAWAAGLAFASVTLAGCCLALGVAIGQVDRTGRWARAEAREEQTGLNPSPRPSMTPRQPSTPS